MTFFGKAYAFFEQRGDNGEAPAFLQANQSAVLRNDENLHQGKADGLR